MIVYGRILDNRIYIVAEVKDKHTLKWAFAFSEEGFTKRVIMLNDNNDIVDKNVDGLKTPIKRLCMRELFHPEVRVENAR